MSCRGHKPAPGSWGWAGVRCCGRWQHDGVPGQRLAQPPGETTGPESGDVEGSPVALEHAPDGPQRPAQAGQVCPAARGQCLVGQPLVGGRLRGVTARRADRARSRPLALRLTILPPNLPPNGTGRRMAAVHERGQKSRSAR